MKKVIDHVNRTITYSFPPKRIISLAPAITNTMYSLNLEKEIVGRTRFCIHPQNKVEQAINIGGTKDIKLDRIKELKPDLVIAEKEENTKEIVEELEKHFPLFVFEIQTVEDAYVMMTDLGTIVNRQDEAARLVKQIKKSFINLPQLQGKKVAYVIWKRPYMVVGDNTYIQSLLEKMGFINPFKKFSGRYPEVTIEDLQKANIDYIFLATEPYPFRNKDIEITAKLLPGVQPMIIDGEMFWYGVKMLDAGPYFTNSFKHLLK